MKHTSTRLVIAWLALFTLSTLRAQVTPPIVTPGATTNSTATPTTESDAMLAAVLLTGSDNAVALAGLAQQRAQSAEVKQFAAAIASEHGRLSQRLQSFANATAGGDPAQRPLDANVQRQGPRIGGFDHAALIRDLGKKCRETELNLLNAKTGVEFDRCYMRMQIVSQHRAIDMLTVFSAYASAQLRPTLDEGRTALQANLETASSLCDQIEKRDPTAKEAPGEKGVAERRKQP